MAEPLKEMFFTDEFIEQLGQRIQAAYPEFDRERLTQLVHDADWADRELKAKMRHVTGCLHATLPAEYARALDILLQVGPHFRGFRRHDLPRLCGMLRTG